MIKTADSSADKFFETLKSFKQNHQEWDINELVPIDKSGTKMSLFYLACQHRRLDIILELLKTGIKIDGIQCSTGNSPLHVCCLNQYKELVILLLYAGAYPGYRNSDDRLPDYTFSGQENIELMAIWDVYNTGGLELFRRTYKDYFIEERQATVGTLLNRSDDLLVQLWPKSHFDLPESLQQCILQTLQMLKHYPKPLKKRIVEYVILSFIQNIKQPV